MSRKELLQDKSWLESQIKKGVKISIIAYKAHSTELAVKTWMKTHGIKPYWKYRLLILGKRLVNYITI